MPVLVYVRLRQSFVLSQLPLQTTNGPPRTTATDYNHVSGDEETHSLPPSKKRSLCTDLAFVCYCFGFCRVDGAGSGGWWFGAGFNGKHILLVNGVSKVTHIEW